MSVISKTSGKILICVVLVSFYFIGLFVFESVYNQQGAVLRTPASLHIAEHKKLKLNEFMEMEKPRASVRILGDPVEKTESGTFILRATLVSKIDSVEEIHYRWILPENVYVISGATEGTLIIDEEDFVQIELGTNETENEVNIYLESYVIHDNMKLGSTRNYILNQKPLDKKFLETQQSFQNNLPQKIFQ